MNFRDVPAARRDFLVDQRVRTPRMRFEVTLRRIQIDPVIFAGTLPRLIAQFVSVDAVRPGGRKVRLASRRGNR
jgi:hypothetical protein